MIRVARDLLQYRELVATLAWKQIIVRYKQSFLGLFWTVLKPVTLTLVFTLLNMFVGITSGGIPYPVITFAALVPWLFFQEAASEGVGSIVHNAQLIRKIYFPREVFPVTAVITKITEYAINCGVLTLLIYYFEIPLTTAIMWIPLITIYLFVVSTAVAFAGSALNVFYRDVGAMLPILFQLAMYASPVIYPMDVVRKTFLEQRAAGDWSDVAYRIYTMNPLAGIVDSFQRAALHGKGPDWDVVWPGLLTTLVVLPLSFVVFRRAERYFADVV